ncbi:MAG TPA: class I SAM-dependent methyltransferase [Candidatus Acidoferrales bacterium]|nr:class I SAM-dependent methyltransferase [Candidatus Acidoferrales bacterium]
MHEAANQSILTASGTTRSGEPFWDRAAETYAQDFASTVIGRTRREAIWRELDAVFRPGQRVLEINCGTGLDAVHLAQRGINVLACDISPRMIELAREQARAANVADRASFRLLANEQLASLASEGPFDGAFSSFSGLNCVADLTAVRANLARLVRPGGVFVASVIGRFVPWELIWFAAHGNFRSAARRWNWRNSFALEGDGIAVTVRSIREMQRAFAPEFRLVQWKGIGIAVPPSYLERWAARFPRTTRSLAQMDCLLARIPLIRGMADCALLRFERTEGVERGK